MTADSIGKYRVIGKLGQGGMARVLLTVVAGSHGVTKLLVLKELKEELAQDGDFVTMFLNEARLAARLNHPNVVQTYEVGQEGEKYFIAMEYLEGQPLHAILRRVGRPTVPLDIHLRIIADTLRGLEYAHSLTDFDGTPLNVVHRDISPQNVFVTYDGQVKLVDFGIAKVAGANTNTQEGMFKGKLSYVAPEQVRCDKIDSRADIFAVGVMLWEAIAGRRMVGREEDERSIISRRIQGTDTKIREVVPDVSPSLADICDRAMGLLPEERFQSAKAFHEALEDWLEEAGCRVGSKELGALVSTAFEADRAKVRTLVDDQLKALVEQMPRAAFAITGTYTNVSSQVGHLLAGAATRNSSFPNTPNTPASSSYQNRSSTDLVAAAPVSAVPPPANSFRSMMTPVLLGGAVVVAGGLAAFAFIRRDSSASTSSPASTRADDAAKPAPALAAKGDQIDISIRYPDGAIAKLDGGNVDGNPFKAHVAKDGSIHQLEVSQDGFVTDKRTITFDKDFDLSVTLGKSKDKPEKPTTVALTPRTVIVTVPAPRTDPPRVDTLPPPPEDPPPVVRPGKKPGVELDDSNPYKKK